MNKKIIKIGVIGGMGPLASASFIETIYTTYLQNEALIQHYHPPYAYLFSEPLLSQSTSVMSLNQSKIELLSKLEKNTAYLMQLEVDCIIICCFTAHALLSKLLPLHQAKIYSLVTSVLEHVLKQKTQFIVLCASSAKEARVLESHPLWPKVAHQINFVAQKTQKQLNLLIKMVKNNQLGSQVLDDFLEFMNQFSDCQFIIACAELHILHKKFQTYSETPIDLVFDPFCHIAQNIWGEMV